MKSVSLEVTIRGWFVLVPYDIRPSGSCVHPHADDVSHVVQLARVERGC
jgi:hypothetical protein